MMTRKHYEKAAAIVRASMKNKEADSNSIAAAFVTFFENDNPKFDRKRFLDACERDLPKQAA